jgi:hypothetical protein
MNPEAPLSTQVLEPETAVAEADLAAGAARVALDANVEARTQLRREVGKREFRLAIHDLAEGLRGIIRAAPLAALLAGVSAGYMLRGRRRGPVRRS